MKKQHLFLALITCFSVACKQAPQEKNDEPLAVELINPSATSENKTLNFSGNIEPNETVRLGFMVAGKINHISTHEGEAIEKGKLLASLESESYAHGLTMAQAQERQMQDDFNRVKELYARKSIAESEFIKVQNGLAAATAQAELQQKQLDDTKLYAPISGILLKRGVEKGEVIDKGLPLFAIADVSSVKVAVAVPEHEIHLIKLGHSAQIFVSATQKHFKGEVCEIGALADGATRSYTVKVRVENPNHQLQIGMMADVSLASSQQSALLTLPVHCIQKSASNQYYIYIAENGKAFRKMVSIGEIIGNQIEIIEGVQAHDKVISSRLSEITNQCEVRSQLY
ncbi:MAG: efflux RND transporter periplasmic adaptor subunit [Mangrovibacterium sp.]